MSRLVTAVFYERSEAERAVETLKAQGIPADSIYLEEEVEPGAEMGRKGGELIRAEQERRIAGLETGLIIGLAVGAIAGMGIGLLSSGLDALVRSANPGGIDTRLVTAMGNPVLTTLIGATLGLIVGALIGWVVDYTLDRMGAGPPLPKHEALVTIRTDEAQLNDVYAALFRERARHLHVSQAGAA